MFSRLQFKEVSIESYSARACSNCWGVLSIHMVGLIFGVGDLRGQCKTRRLLTTYINHDDMDFFFEDRIEVLFKQIL